MEKENTPYLHVYSPRSWHDEAIIVGNREALFKLYNAVHEALLMPNGSGKADAFTADGEGFTVHVVELSSELASSSQWSGLVLPYTDKELVGAYDCDLAPEDLVRERTGKEDII